jgi:hypothetical protein
MRQGRLLDLTQIPDHRESGSLPLLALIGDRLHGGLDRFLVAQVIVRIGFRSASSS